MGKNFGSTGFLFGANSVFIEELYRKYLEDPSSIDPSWGEFFAQENGLIPFKSTSKIINKDPIIQSSPQNNAQTASEGENRWKAKFMINAYREHGHYLANLDPLDLEVKKTHAEIGFNIEDFGFGENDLLGQIDVTNEFGDLTNCSISQLRDALESTYSGNIAVEFDHLENISEQKWLYDQFERATDGNSFSTEEKKQFLKELVEVEGFEQYLHTKFPGAKRFSIEGGDASIVCLDTVIEESAVAGVEEAVLGMAHRGRLSTLTKVMQKPYRAVLSEFSGNSAFPADLDIAGDVKYHMGYSSDKITKGGQKIHLSLMPNPSHLEAVNPVVAGKVRAKQDYKDRDREKVVGIIVHGDAAFCGQGVVAESLVMSGLKAYDVGGIFHLVINNQVGFTANSHDGRTGRYCTEVAKMAGAPIIHVNGEDIESVVLATRLACAYRNKFSKDVVVDIICYRKYGHNEGDEPMYTQALMYNVIKNKKTPAAIYAEQLSSQGIIDADHYLRLKQEFKEFLDQEFDQSKEYKPKAQWLEGLWTGFERNDKNVPITGVDAAKLKKITEILCTIPESFAANSKLEKLFAARVADMQSNEPIDWATAEQLAFASLLEENIPIRITGQDAGRGTFSHRHSVLHSQTDNSTYEPLNNISKDQAFFEVADSNLSEYGVLGFEYGYSLVNPKHLVIWEAQFGDFCNGAQIMFDQFISSAETKWLRMSGLVCLLPNGMEGQGPEHSSARLERFLQLCGEDNMRVVYPTTPASIFHLLRSQVLSNSRKPLIVMSPKSLLRHKLAVSQLSELDEGTSFISVIDEIDQEIKTEKVKKVIFCSGKIYYDLFEARRAKQMQDIAIIRLEQLYPFEHDVIVKIIAKYSKADDFVWCQEEPQNMGAWQFINPRLNKALQDAGIGKSIEYMGRSQASSPAVGNLYAHNKQQEALVNKALEKYTK